MLQKSLMIAAGVVLAAGLVSAQVERGEWCARVEVGTEAVTAIGTGTSYSVQKCEDLQLLVLFLTPVSGDHVLELKIETPNGHHYQTLTAPIATDRSEAGAQRMVDTYPRPLDVQVLETYQTREGARLGTPMWLPVAGTSIVSSGLYGQWEARVYLDGEEMPCKVRNVFTITQ